MENFIFCAVSTATKLQSHCKSHFTFNHLVSKNPSQPAFTCSKLTIETSEQGVKYGTKYLRVDQEKFVEDSL